LDNVNVGKIDCIYGIKIFKGMKTGILLSVAENFELGNNIQKCFDSIDAVVDFLYCKKNNCSQLFNIIDNKVLNHYIKGKTGLLFNKKELENILYQSIKLDTYLYNEKKFDFNNQTIFENVNKIVRMGENLFGSFEEFKNTISFKFLLFRRVAVLGIISYELHYNN